MRATSPTTSLLSSLLVMGVLAACGGGASPSTARPPEPAPLQPAVVGESIEPLLTPVAIPSNDAEFTLVSFFATWCSSSSKWMPVVEALRRKHGARLAVLGVANGDESSQAELETFAHEHGATFPVSQDPDHRIVKALRPRGWGQAIVVLDRRGKIRLVHRGTGEGAFESVQTQLDALLAEH